MLGLTSRTTRTLALTLAGGALVAGCTAVSEPDASTRENESRLNTQEKLVANQPAATMDYSPTRATKNFWVETWDEPGKLSYTYLQNGDGSWDYYILEGLPVSYCTGLVSPDRLVDAPHDGDSVPDFVMRAPSVDGTYSSGSNCNTYYGKDAVSGQYMEYTVGMGQNARTFDQPSNRIKNATPAGDATITDPKVVAATPK